jgi:hypothetical protein
MNIDAGDIFISTIREVFGRMILLVLAVWFGCCLGGCGILAGQMMRSGGVTRDLASFLWLSPFLLFNVWAVLNVPFLLFYAMKFVRAEGDVYLNWGVIVAVESLVVMLGWGQFSIYPWLPLLVAWGTWLWLVGMMGVGVWFIRQYWIQRWVRDMALLRAANAQQRMEREQAEQQRRLNHAEWHRQSKSSEVKPDAF